MRVLDLNTLYIDGGEGGVNTYLREKARCLADPEALGGRKIHHAMVVPGASTRKEALGASTLYTLKSPRVPGNAQHRLLVDFARIGAILKEEKPDVIEIDCSYLLGHVARRALRPRKPAIVGFYHVHLPRLYTRAGRSWLGSKVSRRTETFAWRYARLCAKPCDRVVVTTRDLHSRLQGKGFPRLEIVPLGVNLELFRPRVNGTRPRVDGIDPARPVVLYVGRLSREKDLQVLYDAHTELRDHCGTQLLIAGDGPLRRQAARLARSRPGVVYSGVCPYGERLADLYRSADVLAVPGRNETFSLIVLEAFASGLPVVAVDEGGPSELCRGAPGDLARAGDARDFAAKLRAALNGRVPSYYCRSQVEARYSWESTFNRLLDVYESIEGVESAAREDGDLEWEPEEAAELRLP
jgi:glycosyltransferase involved in cell wall biosynthesis